MSDRRGKTLLIISQTFVPDPASVGQHVADVAIEMARRGHPKPSHITDLMEANELGWHVAHGDVHGAVAAIRTMRELGDAGLTAMGRRAQSVLQQNLSQQRLCGAMCDRVEATIFNG